MTPLPLMVAVTTTMTAAAPLTMNQVLAEAEARHPAVSAAHHTVRAARSNLRAATGAFDLRLRAAAGGAPVGPYGQLGAAIGVEQRVRWWGASVTSGYRYGAQYPGYKGERMTPSQGALHLGVRVPLLRGRETDKARFGVHRGRAGVSLAQQAALDTARRVALDAGRAWITWVASGARLRIALEQQRLAKARAVAVRGQVARGAIAALAIVDNQRTLLARQAKVVGARQKLRQAAVVLGLYVRDTRGKRAPPGVHRLPATLSVGDTPSPAVLMRALPNLAARRPDLRGKAERIRLAQARLRLQAQKLLPKLDLKVEAIQGVGESTAWLPGQTINAGTAATAKLSFSLPAQRREATGKLAAAHAKLRAAKAKLRLAVDKAEVEVRKAALAWAATGLQHRYSKAAAAAAQTLADGERRKWQLGRSDLLRVQLRERGVAQAALKEVDAAEAWHRARLAFAVSAALPVR
ncbi:MAG: TolC family protein [Myxococcales bacterium]|nr:TolC family protein [Myxococcales bacterium]